MRDTIDMARETKMPYDFVTGEPIYIEKLKAFEALVRADEREALIGLLKGIDKTEIESADGWWETSSGAEFGAGILSAMRARGNT